MAKRKKRTVATKKKKYDDDDDNDEVDEPVAKKLEMASSTSSPDDDASRTSSFSVEGINIGRSDTMGGEVGFSTHFWCNYCEYSSDTKKELVTHMRQHMTKCSYCNFSSLSKAEIAKHVKCEHADEAEKTICEVDSSSSGTEHDMDKDPCSACIFCDFMTYSTEHLEKHTTSKHQGMLPKSVAKMISKQVSARIRRDDAVFYCTISSDNYDKPTAEGENIFNSKYLESNESKCSIVIEADSEKLNIDVKPSISPHSSVQDLVADMKPNPHTLSQRDQSVSDQNQDTTKVDDWRVKVETLYCLSCPYSNVAIEKLKCHALTQHPEGVAAASFVSETTYRLQDITFYCARESCSYSSVQCGDYEDHLMKCCFSPDSLLFGEKERLKDTIKFIFKCQEKQGMAQSKGFSEFSSQYVLHKLSCNSPPIIPSTVENEVDSRSNTSSTQNTSNDNNFAVSSSQNNLSASNIVTQAESLNRQERSDNPPSHQNTTFCSNINTSTGSQNFHAPTSAKLQQGQALINSNSSQQPQQGFNSNQFDNNYDPNSNPSSNNTLQHNSTPIVHDSNQQCSNSFSQPQYSSSHHSHEPVRGNFNTNTVPVGQQNMYAPQSLLNSEPIVAPSFDSPVPIISDQNSSQPSFPQQQQQPTYHQGSALTCSANQQTGITTSQPNVQEPKILDILTNANAILLDDNLGLQSWSTNQSNDSLPPQNNDHSQSSLHTPPLPQENATNSPIFASNANLEVASQPHNSSLPLSDASLIPTHPPTTISSEFFPTNTNPPTTLPTNQSHPPVQQNITGMVIDLDSPPSYTTPTSTSSSSQHSLQNPTASMNFDTGNGNPVEIAPPEQSSMASSDVPNFLVPSASMSESIPKDSHQPDSFLTNSVPPQSLSDQTPSMDYPSTPPSQKNIPFTAGESRFPVGNSPLSPSIYLNSGGMQPQRSSSTDNSPMQLVGSSPIGPQFIPPAPQGMNFNGQQPTSNVRQRLFTAIGHPRGPRMQQRMVRPPSNPVDDDVIVTAVVRSPVQQRPPRGRGMAVGGRGMAPNQRGMNPNTRGMVPGGRGAPPGGRGMAPGGRGMAPGGRGMAPRGRGMAPRGRGMAPRGRGMPPNIRGRAGVPVQTGMPRGRGRAMPSSMSPQGKQGIDVSGHYVDLACVVNANEEGEEDEIQIVGVTPGKGGNPQSKAVDSKKFSYCCIHCGQDQGYKETMKKHIKSSHSESLLGALRNVETGQWLCFCPQLTCEFMTYDETRLINHLFSCYNLDKSKPLPYDMQSSLRNLKSLRMRNVEGTVGRGAKNPVSMNGQGLRDTFNNNLKDAFDDMVENTMGRQMIRPNQPPQRPTLSYNQQPPPSYPNQRGAPRGAYSPRGTPPQNTRYGFPGPQGYRQRSPMMGGSPRQPRYPGSPVRPRGPNQQFATRGMPPSRGGPSPSMRGQRQPNPRGGFAPGPRFLGPTAPGNEQSPIIIDLDVDSPGKAPDGDTEVQELAPATVVSDNISHLPMDVETPSTNNSVQVATSSPIIHNNHGPMPASYNPPGYPSAMQTVASDLISNNEPTLSSASNNHSNVLDPNCTYPPSNQFHHSGYPSVDNVNSGNDKVSSSASSDNSLPQSAINNQLPSSSLATYPSAENAPTSQSTLSTSGNVPATYSSADNAPTSQSTLSTSGNVPATYSSADNAPTSQSTLSTSGNVPAPPTSVRNIPSPSQLLAEMNSMTDKHATVPQLPSNTISNHPPQSSRVSPLEQNRMDGTGENPLPADNDEEIVNTILLDKVFAKVPHMPKKLSQRLVLKFKKYAADRGMVITPTSRVIDEFVSKISYKGSHSAPTPIATENKSIGEYNQPTQAVTLEPKSAVGDETGASPENYSHQTPTTFETGNSAVSNFAPQNPSTALPLRSDLTLPPSSSSSSPFPNPDPNSNNDEVAEPSQAVTKSDDVIETKVIFAERKLQFKGAFANIIKEKSALSSSSIPPVTNEDSQNYLNAASGNSSQDAPSVPHQISSDANRGTSNGSIGDSDGDVITKSLKTEIVEPVAFPSVSEEHSIEVKSSVDHIVCGHASLEVDIAGKPLSASAFTDKEKLMEGTQNDEMHKLDPNSTGLSEKSHGNMSIDSSSGTLKFKIRKGTKPRVLFQGRKEDEIVQYKSGDSSDGFAPEDQLVRRSERKRKAVKVDYDTHELGEMDELMSDEDDEYHMESDESYDGSDGDEWGKKKMKKTKAPQDPKAFDIVTKGCFGCWKCSKVFSRVMFLKRHIIKKHKEGLCAIVFTETGIPSNDQPSVLLFCPQSCKYVTSDCDAYTGHIEACTQPRLDIQDVDYKAVQETFFKNDFNPLCDSVTSGVISTKIPVKPTPRKKSLTSAPSSAPSLGPTIPDMEGVMVQAGAGNGEQRPHATTIVTTATIHQPPSQSMHNPYPYSHPHQEMETGAMSYEGSHDGYYGEDEMLPCDDDPDMLYSEEQY